jgi:multiple sugar transport system substrate-binding protein
MKFSRLLLPLIILASTVLSACQPAPSKPGGNISFMISGDPAELAAYHKVVDAFNAKHPEVTVEVIEVSSDDYTKRLGADLAAGSPADVFFLNYRAYASYADAGALAPVGTYLANSTVIKESDFYSQAMEPFNWKGEQMCIPQNISSLVVYYNKDMFKEAGVAMPTSDWTWSDFTGAALALTKDLDGDGATDQFGAGIEPEFIRLAPFIWQSDGELVDDPTNPTTLMLDTDAAYTAVEFFVGLQTIQHVVPNAEQEASESSQSRFINGRTAMFFQSRRPVPTFRESIKFDWDVAPQPHGKNPATILHSDGYCMPSASKNKDAAWVFIEFANSVEGQTIIAGTGRTVPSLKAVAESPAFLDPSAKPASSQVFLDVIPTIHALPIVPKWGEIEDIVSEELTRAFYGQADLYMAMLQAVDRTREYLAINQ